jgi:zinc transport system ATP-binding protein
MAHSGEPVVRVSNLRVILDGQIVLADVSFTLQRGEVLTILGPNGAGKTILLRALLGAVPHEGEIVWEKDVRIGYVPQRLPYIKNIPLSVADFFALRPGGGRRVGQVLSAVGLGAEIARKPIGELSSGQFQRILIAWALAGDPDVLLFDEPTAGIDLGGEETVYGLLGELQRERNLAMLLVTHDLAAVHRLSSTVLCLNKRPLCVGPPVSILTPQTLEQLYGSDVRFYVHHHDPGA